jgi:DNA polymerase
MTNNDKNKIIDLLNSYKLCGIKYIEPLNLNHQQTDKSELPNSIDELEQYVNHCNLCELSKVKQKQIFSLGDEQSDIMMIGLKYNFLDEHIMQMIKNIITKVLLLDFNKVYITNVLKCNVDTKIDISEQSINLCGDYLLKEIQIVKPKIIITFGLAFNYLLNNQDNILDISGNLYEYNKIKVIPLLDLDFIYKNPSYKQDMFSDLKKIKMLME